MSPRSSGLALWLLFVVLALGLGGCAGLSGVLHDPPNLAERPAEPSPPVTVVGATDSETDGADRHPVTLATTPDLEDARPGALLAADADAVAIAQ